MLKINKPNSVSKIILKKDGYSWLIEWTTQKNPNDVEYLIFSTLPSNLFKFVTWDVNFIRSKDEINAC
jgi:hypothetical protein